MKKNLISYTIVILLLTSFLGFGKDLKFEKSFKDDKPFFHSIGKCIVMENGALIGAFARVGVVYFDSKGLKVMATLGQGPEEIDVISFMCLKGKDLAVNGRAGRIKIFSLKDSTIKYKSTTWKQTLMRDFPASAGIFYDGKWFIAGYNNNLKSVNEDYTAYYAKAYDEKGKFLEYLVAKKHSKLMRDYLMSGYLIPNGKTVYFLLENEPVVRVISTENLTVTKSVSLEVPGYYKKMPENFYVFERLDSPNQLIKVLEKWKTGYSRITRALIEGKHLVIQFRTCDDEMKKFALLIYDKDTFKLQQTILTDDYLLASRDGRFYFYKNGEPKYDDEADETVIDIYKYE